MLTQLALQAMALSLIAGTASAAVTFTPIGVPPAGDPQTPPFSEGYGVSDDGTVVGSQFVPGSGFLSFRWTAGGGRQTINGLFPTSGIFARSITPDGRVIVGENTSPGVAFRQVNGGAIESLGLSDPDLYDQSAGSDVSNDGRVVSGLLSRIEDGTFRAARWEEGAGWQDLGVLSGDYESSANAISGDGSVVAGYSVGNYFTAVKWTSAGGLEALPNPFNITGNSAVIAMAADGSSFVGQANNDSGLSQAVVWGSNGSTQVLDLVPGFDSAAAFGVSGNGSIIGGTAYIDGVGSDIAAFWTSDGTAYDLKAYLADNGISLPGWNLLAVTEVSQNGLYLTGRGINPDGNLEGFFVQIPAPASALPMMVGMVFAGRRRRG
jgi:uncharacterized membrane protein